MNKLPKIIFSDFDGTLTDEGKLTPHFFQILDWCKKFNIPFIIVSGRSLSWGHFFLTHFPIQYAIMEGGGVLIKKREDYLFEEHCLCTDEEVKKLQDVEAEFRMAFPTALLSADSFGRKTDRAVEMKGNPFYNRDAFYRFFDARGVKYSHSNVHINFWTGNLSKFNATKFLLEQHFPDISFEQCLFFGDAPNDESMFKGIPHSVGVSNIEKYLPEIKHPPQVILKGSENAGPAGVLNYLNKISTAL